MRHACHASAVQLEISLQQTVIVTRPEACSPALVTLPPLMAACGSLSSQGWASKLLQASRP
jgi:hypothetical protein